MTNWIGMIFAALHGPSLNSNRTSHFKRWQHLTSNKKQLVQVLNLGWILSYSVERRKYNAANNNMTERKTRLSLERVKHDFCLQPNHLIIFTIFPVIGRISLSPLHVPCISTKKLIFHLLTIALSTDTTSAKPSLLLIMPIWLLLMICKLWLRLWQTGSISSSLFYL